MGELVLYWSDEQGQRASLVWQHCRACSPSEQVVADLVRGVRARMPADAWPAAQLRALPGVAA